MKSAVIGILYALSAIFVLVPFTSFLITAKAYAYGRYLNRYFIVRYRGSGIYELHCSPAFGFYYAKPDKYFTLQDNAIRKFKVGYPDTTLYAITSTLQKYYFSRGHVGDPVVNTCKRRFSSYFLILRNIANYRKRGIIHLLQQVRQTTPQRFWL